jgi:hypothetical protein
MNAAEIKIKGYEMLRKHAKLMGKNSSSCTIYVPKEWHGKNVTIILNDKLE